MSWLLDLLLIIAVIGAVLDGFRGGMIKGALRLVGVIVGLLLASMALSAILASRGDADPWVIVVTMLLLPGLFSAIVELLYRVLFGKADLEADTNNRPSVKLKRVAHSVFTLEPNRSMVGRMLGAAFSALAVGIGNGVFVLLLQIVPVEWLNTLIAGSGAADSFIRLVQTVSFALPPQMHLWL